MASLIVRARPQLGQFVGMGYHSELVVSITDLYASYGPVNSPFIFNRVTSGDISFGGEKTVKQEEITNTVLVEIHLVEKREIP